MENKSLFEQFSDSHEELNYEEFISPPPTKEDCCNAIEKSIEIPSCELMSSRDISFKLDCQGRLLKVKAKVQGVCPNKNVTVGVLVFENNKLLTFKVREVFTGGRAGDKCRDLDLGDFCFVFKEDNPCSSRCFNIKVIANYTNVC